MVYMKKLITIILTLFFSGMLALTLTARLIHNKTLCRVKITEVKKQDFICKFIDEHGKEYTTQRRAIGIPKNFFDNDIYIVEEIEVYGEKRKCAAKVELSVQNDYYSDDYCAVDFGLSVGDNIITYNPRLYDGCEIVIS